MARSATTISLALFILFSLLLGLVTCHDDHKDDGGHDDHNGHDGYGNTIRVKAGQSIQAAIHDAKPGDHIIVDAGNYTEQVTITKDNVQLSGRTGATILLPAVFTPNNCSGLAGPGSEAGICISGSDITFGEFEEHRKVTDVGRRVKNVQVEGFTVVGFELNIAILGADHAEVRGNTVVDGQGYGILTVGSVGSLVTRNTARTTGLFFIGICMDDKSDVHVTQNEISDYGIGLCVQTNGADVGHNKVRNCCFGAFVDPGVDGARVTHNHIGPSNPLCQTLFGGVSGGILVDGATKTQVKHNDVSGISDYGNPNQTAYGIGIVDEPGFVARGNEITHNTVYGNDLDILYFTNGTDNEVDHNKCGTPAEICSKQ